MLPSNVLHRLETIPNQVTLCLREGGIVRYLREHIQTFEMDDGSVYEWDELDYCGQERIVEETVYDLMQNPNKFYAIFFDYMCSLPFYKQIISALIRNKDLYAQHANLLGTTNYEALSVTAPVATNVIEDE